MKEKIGIIGLGYVGLPLAVEFGKFRKVIGFDIDESRVESLRDGVDHTNETSEGELKLAVNLEITSDLKKLKSCKIYIITVPTPIDENNEPDLKILEAASELVGSILKEEDIVIYESTVYPGATEDFCVPILERQSKLKFNKDFFCGYSPERINPGDKLHRLSNIKKVISGSNEKTAIKVNNLYKDIIDAGTFIAKSIKVAEAAKVIENTQRDVNIALINEFAMIFDKMGIDTQDVLDAASTKWNFINFKPGLVGGHCIGIDPYYLAYKSKEIGYCPKMILAGRNINEKMSNFVFQKVENLMKNKKIEVEFSKILIFGFTFKENCPDVRNSKVFDLLNHFKRANCEVDIYDPYANKSDTKKIFGIELHEKPLIGHYDAIIIAVPHDIFRNKKEEYFRSFGKKNHILFEIKYLLSGTEIDGRL